MNVFTATTAPSASTRSTVQRTLRGSPSSVAAQALSIGSAVARGDVDAAAQPVVAAASPLNSSSSRCVNAMPLRGVRITSSSGAGASPLAIADSVAAMRSVLPRAIW